MRSKTKISICLGSSCYRRGNQEVLEIIKEYLKKHQLADQVEFKGHLCTGKCAEGPNLQINDKEFHHVDQNAVIEILDKHFSLV